MKMMIPLKKLVDGARCWSIADCRTYITASLALLYTEMKEGMFEVLEKYTERLGSL